MKKNEKKTDEGFVLKPYSKKELAMMYFPHCTPEAATRRLRKWILRVPELVELLGEWNSLPFARNYSRKHVELIVRYLGEP